MLTPTVTEKHHMCPHVAREAMPKVSMPGTVADRVRASLIAVPEPKAPR